MERGRHRIRLLIILAALIFSLGIVLSGCSSPSPLPSPLPTTSTCNLNSAANVYNCNINFTIANTAGYSQTGGVSVTIANPQ